MKKVIIVALMLGVVSWAVPSMKGTNGLVNMPAASAVKYKEFDVGYNWQSASSNNQISYYFANLGIFDGVELGVIGNSTHEGSFINLKYYMLSDNSEYPLGLAVGVTGLTSYTQTELYMVLSKAFPNKLAGHFGFKTNVNAVKIKADVMFGLEMFMSDHMTVVADIIGSEDVWCLSGGLRVKLMEDVTLNGYLEDVLESKEAKFTLGLSFDGIL